MTELNNTSIQLFSGGHCDFADPASCEFAIIDIAHGLSQMCRFNGQIKRFYSVAQHCYNASMIAPPGFEYEAFTHDWFEAFGADVVTPFKRMLGSVYYEVEQATMDVLGEQFNFNSKMSHQVKLVDLKMLKIEKDYFHGGPEWAMLQDVVVSHAEIARCRLDYLGPPDEFGNCEMKDLFMARFEELTS